MIEISETEIVLCVLAVLAGIAVGLVVILKRRKMVAIRKRAFVVSQAAKEQGLELFAELCESVATGDIMEAIKELETLERMFKTPGALMAHLNVIFTKQLTLRLANPTARKEIVDAVKALEAGEAAAKAAIVKEAENAKILAANAKADPGTAS